MLSRAPPELGRLVGVPLTHPLLRHAVTVDADMTSAGTFA
jgi:hypothetical protein